MKTEDFKFTFEADGDFAVFPTQAVLLIGQPNELLEGGGFPDFNPMMFMHAEDNVEFFKPILPDSKIRSETVIYDVADKGKFALVTVKIKVFDE